MNEYAGNGKEETMIELQHVTKTYAKNHTRAVDDLSLEEFRQFSDCFDEDIYEAISLKTCVEKRLTEGAPGKASMEKAIAASREYLSTRQSAEYTR